MKYYHRFLKIFIDFFKNLWYNTRTSREGFRDIMEHFKDSSIMATGFIIHICSLLEQVNILLSTLIGILTLIYAIEKLIDYNKNRKDIEWKE